MRFILPDGDHNVWRLGILILLVLLPLNVLAAPILNQMTKQETPGQTRISLFFSEVPDFNLKTTGQRIDLELNATTADEALRILPEDEMIMNVTLAERTGRLRVSILLRQPPQQVSAESPAGEARINVNIFWQESGSVRPGVAFNIAGMPARKAGRRAAAYQNRSAWEDDWYRFFAEYRQGWKVHLPLKYTLPELPFLVTDEDSPVMPLQEFADEGLFLSLLRAAGEVMNLTDEQRYQRDILVAEAQLRSDALEAGLARLEAMRKQSEKKSVRVEYLTAYAQAVAGQPIVGQLKLTQMLPDMADDDAFTPLYHLLVAETDFAVQRDKDAVDHLTMENVQWPVELNDMLALRRADALAGAQQPDQATDAYKKLATDPEFLERHLFSMNRAAFAAFQSGAYDFSATLYRRLIEIIEQEDSRPEGFDLLLFAAGVAAYEAGDTAWGKIGLEKAIYDKQSTEGAERGKLRLIDLKVIAGGEFELEKAVLEYGALAAQSTYRVVREESIFKKALGQYLLGEYQESVDELMTFQRDYFSSALRHDAEVLLAKQVPLVVHQLLKDKKDLDAVVLVEKNRKLLLNSGFDRQFLNDLSAAFNRLGLYERSARVLLYMLDQTKDSAKRAPIYLPLVTSYLKRGDLDKVTDYASRYLNDYPQGKDASAMLDLLFDAYEKLGQQDKILAWLDKKERPTSPNLEIRAAWAYWHSGEQKKVIDSLKRARQEGAKLQVKEMALLAESIFEQGDMTAAKREYEALIEDKDYAPQALYRMAQILINQKEKDKAQEYIKRLQDEHANSSWAKLAQDLLNDY